MKKIISLLAAVIILLSLAITASAQGETTFEDVSDEHYAHDAVEYLYRENVIKGVGDNKFEPDAYITREQFAKMISIIYGKEEFKPAGQTFSDVTPDMWSYTYIESVKEYLTGYYPEGGAAFFNPAAKATREDIAYALVKIGGLEKYKDISVLDKYEDKLQISVNLREYIGAAVNAGLMQGYEGRIRPQDGCTRAEVAALLFRAIKKPVDTENKENEIKTEVTVSDSENKEEETKKETVPVENVIIAENILEFKIINTEGENIFVDDEDRLDGYAKIIFGEDGIKDTKLIAEITVDQKDKYYIESFAVDRYDKTADYVLLELSYKVYKNEKLIIEKGGYRLYTHKEDDEMTLLGRTRFVAWDVTWASGTLPAVPENQPWEVWADSSLISYRVYEGEEDTGYINYIYKTAEKISKFDSAFSLNGKEYSVELTAENSKTGSQLNGTFNIICNGETVAENVKGTITGYNGHPGESAKLSFDGDFPEINLIIVEKSQ